MAIGFAFEGGAAFAYPPAEIEVIEPTGVEDQTTDGGYVATPRSKGAEIRVRWKGARTTALLAALRSARGTTIAHTIGWTDLDTSTKSYKVNWLALPPYSISNAELYGDIVIVFRQRPD